MSQQGSSSQGSDLSSPLGDKELWKLCERELWSLTENVIQQKIAKGHFAESQIDAGLSVLSLIPNEKEGRTLPYSLTHHLASIQNLADSSSCEHVPLNVKENPVEKGLPGSSTDLCTPCERETLSFKQGKLDGSSSGTYVPRKRERTNLTKHSAEKEIQQKKIRIHTCDECGKSFKFKSVLLKHKRIHSTERPFKCTVCGAAFKQYGCLLGHNKIHTLAGSFVCEECGKGFNCKKNLVTHRLTHSNEKPFVCPDCGKGFTVKESLKSHQKVHQKAPDHKKVKNSPLKCKICDQEFKYNNNLVVHERIHSGEKCFSCRQCWKIFGCEKSLQRHQRQHNRGQKQHKQETESTFTCSKCKRTFEWETSLIIHQCSYQAERPFKCATCGQTFKTESNLKAHEQVHTGEKWYSCEECGEGFNRKISLRKHEMIHTGHTPFECSKCGRGFCSNYALRRHQSVDRCKIEENLQQSTNLGKANLMETSAVKDTAKEIKYLNCKNSSEDDRHYKCTICGQCFSHELKQLLHERSHTDSKNYSCIECRKAFKCNRALWSHIRTHTGENMCNRTLWGRLKTHTDENTCTECGKSFALKSSLTMHSRVHTGEMPYKCEECGKSFKWRSIFVYHKMRHTGEKAYQCGQCNKRFSSHSALSMHRKLHAGVKAFTCLECGKSFIHKSELKRHQVMHTGVKPYQCSECHKRFSWSSALSTHRKTHVAEKSFICMECGKAFKTSNVFENHKKRMHSREKTYQCDQCDKRFFWRSALLIHLKIHAAGEVLKCSKPESTISIKSDLAPHEVLHTGEKPFLCVECGKRYWLKHTLKVHMKTHTGEVQCMFPECAKVFRHRLDMERHQKTHSITGLFTCTVCDKNFTGKRNYLMHEKIHSMDRPFSCYKCKKSYKQKCQLMAHQRTHTDESLFSCEACGKSFSHKKSLLLHRISHNRDKQLSHTDWGESLSREQGIFVHQKIYCKNRLNLESALAVNKSEHFGQQRAATTSDVTMPCVTTTADATPSVEKQVAVAELSAMTSSLNSIPGAKSDSQMLVEAIPLLKFPPATIKELTLMPSTDLKASVKFGESCNLITSLADPLETHVMHTSANHTQKASSESGEISASEKSFWCADCGLGWKDESMFSEHHRLWHMSKRPRPCWQCGKKFSTKFDFEKHWRTHRDEGLCGMHDVTVKTINSPAAAVTRLNFSVATISAAMKLVAVAKRTALKAFSTKTLASKSAAEVPVGNSQMKFPVVMVSDAISTSTVSHTTYIPNASGVPDQGTTSQSCVISSFWCVHCAMGFKYEALFRRHQSWWHLSKRQRPCQQCGETFKTRFDFEKHRETHIANGDCEYTPTTNVPLVLPAVIMHDMPKCAVTEFNDAVPKVARPVHQLCDESAMMVSVTVQAMATKSLETEQATPGLNDAMPTLNMHTAIPGAAKMSVDMKPPVHAVNELIDTNVTEGNSARCMLALSNSAATTLNSAECPSLTADAGTATMTELYNTIPIVAVPGIRLSEDMPDSSGCGC
ncbi:zinc finger protein 721-like [Pleurodeles waltl]|uniref:zinc finger protein 721-like n=1 Tax=Pleurodeles waltl TaxID=8319 RepID=UPI0037094D33